MTAAHPDSQLKKAVDNGFDPKLLYDVNLIQVNESIRAVFEEYSKIPAEKIQQHVQGVRDSAFAVFPYACIGQCSFLELSIASSPCYPEILRRVKEGDKLLDLGCAFGQELRQLLFDGAPAKRLYGSDLRQEFLDLGCDLFRDHATMNTQMICADITDAQSNLIKRLSGHIDMIYISLFMHVFDWEQQVAVVKAMFNLLASKPGSLMVFRVVACRSQAELNATHARMPYYYHDKASWDQLWERVQSETAARLRVESWEQPDELAVKHPLQGIYVLGSAIRIE